MWVDWLLDAEIGGRVRFGVVLHRFDSFAYLLEFNEFYRDEGGVSGDDGETT